MGDEMRAYIVRQGDYLVKLAFVHGFDAEEVWKHPRNAELKDLRGNHHVLAPGDVLFIPVKPKDGLPIQKGSVNRYTAKVPKIEVVLAFKGTDGKPLASEPCEVRGLGGVEGADPPKDTTDEDGKLTLKVPVTVREVSVHFPQQNVTYEVRIGEMDPVSEISGIKKRLHNLGLWYEDPDIEMDEEEMLHLAVKRFQAQDDPEASGALDDATKKALQDGHGL